MNRTLIAQIILIGFLLLLFLKVQFSYVCSQVASPCEDQSHKVEYCPVRDARVEITSLNQSQEDKDTAIGGSNVVNMQFYPKRKQEVSYCVPKKIHFLWVGKEIPQKYRDNVLTFVKVNQDYEVILWTEVLSAELLRSMQGVNVKNISKEILGYKTRDLFEKEENFGAKSDILRYEIVYRNGGVYFDTDSVSVRPFHDILTHSFVSCRNEGWNNCQNSVFGFPKGSRFLETVLLMLRWNINKDPGASVPWKTGPAFFSGAFVYYNDPNINMINQHYLCLDNTEKSLSYQTYDATWT